MWSLSGLTFVLGALLAIWLSSWQRCFHLQLQRVGWPPCPWDPQTLQKYNERINAFLGRTPTYPPISQDCFWSKFFFWIWGKAFRWFPVGFPGRFRGVWEEPQAIFKCEYEGATICKFLGTICNFFLIGPLVLAWYWFPEVDSLTRTESSPAKPERLQRCCKRKLDWPLVVSWPTIPWRTAHQSLQPASTAEKGRVWTSTTQCISSSGLAWGNCLWGLELAPWCNWTSILSSYQ